MFSRVDPINQVRNWQWRSLLCFVFIEGNTGILPLTRSSVVEFECFGELEPPANAAVTLAGGHTASSLSPQTLSKISNRDLTAPLQTSHPEQGIAHRSTISFSAVDRENIPVVEVQRNHVCCSSSKFQRRRGG